MSRPGSVDPAHRAVGGIDRQLILGLGQSARSSLADLAADTGLSLSSVRRRLTHLLTSGQVVLRCDASMPLSGWPIVMRVWGSVDPNDQETIGTLRRLHVTRACLRISGGRPNLLLGIVGRSVHEVPAIESRLAEVAPRPTVLDRSMVLRSIKWIGRVLDAQGRSVRIVRWTSGPILPNCRR